MPINQTISRRSPVSLETAGSWLQRRFEQLNFDANRAFYNSLRNSLPPSARGSFKIGPDGVTGEVSHGLTSEGMKAAHTAMDRAVKVGWDQMLKDFSERFFGGI